MPKTEKIYVVAFGLRLPESAAKQLRTSAKRANKSVSKFLREVVTNFLNQGVN